MSTTTINDPHGEREVPVIYYGEHTVLLPGVNESGEQNEDHTGYGLEARSFEELFDLFELHFGKGRLVEEGFEIGPAASYGDWDDIDDDDEICYVMCCYYTKEDA